MIKCKYPRDHQNKNGSNDIMASSVRMRASDKPRFLAPESYHDYKRSKSLWDVKLPYGKGTRLTAVKQQLLELTEENTRLKNSIKLLESEIDTKMRKLPGRTKVIHTRNRRLKGSSILSIIFVVNFLNSNGTKSLHQLPKLMRKIIFVKINPVLF